MSHSFLTSGDGLSMKSNDSMSSTPKANSCSTTLDRLDLHEKATKDRLCIANTVQGLEIRSISQRQDVKILIEVYQTKKEVFLSS